MGMQKPPQYTFKCRWKGRKMNVLGDNSRKWEGTKDSKNKQALRESYESSIRGWLQKRKRRWLSEHSERLAYCPARCQVYMNTYEDYQCFSAEAGLACVLRMCSFSGLEVTDSHITHHPFFHLGSSQAINPIITQSVSTVWFPQPAEQNIFRMWNVNKVPTVSNSVSFTCGYLIYFKSHLNSKDCQPAWCM